MQLLTAIMPGIGITVKMFCIYEMSGMLCIAFISTAVQRDTSATDVSLPTHEIPVLPMSTQNPPTLHNPRKSGLPLISKSSINLPLSLISRFLPYTSWPFLSSSGSLYHNPSMLSSLLDHRKKTWEAQCSQEDTKQRWCYGHYWENPLTKLHSNLDF